MMVNIGLVVETMEGSVIIVNNLSKASKHKVGQNNGLVAIDDNDFRHGWVFDERLGLMLITEFSAVK